MFNPKLPKAKIYLSRRNLLTLLSKLDRDDQGEDTNCSLIKYKQPSPSYQQTMDAIMVVAVQDDEYYSSQNRTFGDVHPYDDPNKIKIVNEV